MPVAEANEAVHEGDSHSYELAFHILPTVAEGEVPETLSQIKAHITNVGGVIFDEEMPERIDLIYPIVKHMEGKNRTFASAYFGWIRFRLEGEKMEHLEEELRADANILRFLMVKLGKEAEAHPFRYHEHRKSLKMVEVVDEEAEVVKEVLTETEASAPVEEAALDASLEKITQEGEEEKTA